MKSVAKYAAPVWTTWITAINIAFQERAKLNAAGTVTGQIHTTPTDAVICEAHPSPSSDRYQALSLKKIIIGLCSTGQQHFTTNTSKTTSPSKQPAVAEKTITLNGLTYVQLYTDGYRLNGKQNGGAGVVVHQDGPTDHPWYAPTETFVSSFHCEKSALTCAIPWLHHHDDWSLATNFTHSKCLVRAISNPSSSDPSIHSISPSLQSFHPQNGYRSFGSQVIANVVAMTDEQAKISSSLPYFTCQLGHLNKLGDHP